MKTKKIGLFWFTNDLRLHDNAALALAAKSVDQLLFVYLDDSKRLRPNRYGLYSTSPIRRQFESQSLAQLGERLGEHGQQLHSLSGDTQAVLGSTLMDMDLAITHVFRSQHAGLSEQQDWHRLIESHPSIEFTTCDTHTLLDQAQLPFNDTGLPATFSKFRKVVQDLTLPDPVPSPTKLPPAPDFSKPARLPLEINAPINRFQGGEKAGRDHLDHYFSTRLPASYKDVRNAIDGWDNSCKLSPWLANGCFSARDVMQRVKAYEAAHTANESTYWIYFELLWREYFQWYAHQNGARLFRFKGIKARAPLTSFYAERFKKWCTGQTPYPIVNACMNELTHTGYLSNRGRQIVASCFVNELQLDWRYGAAYFEQCLIDYDVASNWGNWQYLAGVGADPKDSRHFNLEKQSQQFDPEKRYIKKWGGDVGMHNLDSVDAADWPII